jgi:ribosomal protein S6
MTLPAPTYDLVLMLDPQAEPDTRAKIVSDTQSSIEAGGELLRHDDWGERALTYPIDKKTSAEYHLFQFHVGEGDLLGGLDRTLRFADVAMRFRIIKLAPGVPAAPDMGATAPAPVPAQQPEPAAATSDEPLADEPAAVEPAAVESEPVADEPESEPAAEPAETEAVEAEAPVAEPTA